MDSSLDKEEEPKFGSMDRGDDKHEAQLLQAPNEFQG
jgi:hypothetical protein